MNNIQYKLRVSCMTFNHSKYITDAMNGFCMQQTDFPFVCTIIDDASTDGEQEVLRNYVKEHFDLSDASVAFEREDENAVTTFAQHKENKNCFFAVIYLKENHYSKAKSKLPYIKEWNQGAKYIALCEGDDYWTDPYKLQKQVDFLEGHEEYSMCYTDYDTVDSTGCLIYWKNHSKNINRSYSGDIFKELIKGNYIQTLTVVYRKSVINDPDYLGGLDYALFLQCAICGKCHFINEKTSCYRLHQNSAIHTINDQLVKTSRKIWAYYVDRYMCTSKFRKPLLEHIRVCGTICAVLISKRRSGGDDETLSKEIMKKYPMLKKYYCIGIVYKLSHAISKLSDR